MKSSNNTYFLLLFFLVKIRIKNRQTLIPFLHGMVLIKDNNIISLAKTITRLINEHKERTPLSLQIF